MMPNDAFARAITFVRVTIDCRSIDRFDAIDIKLRTFVEFAPT